MSEASVTSLYAPQQLPKEALERINVEMRGWSDSLASEGGSNADFFRYESFSRRLQAAEFGRKDALQWAWQWYLDLEASAAKEAQEALEFAKAHQASLEAYRKALTQGVSGNPRFQAFLDTLEDPETELYHEDGTFQGWKYLVWIGPLIGAMEKRKDLPEDHLQRKMLFDDMIKSTSAAQRAHRLGGPVKQT